MGLTDVDGGVGEKERRDEGGRKGIISIKSTFPPPYRPGFIRTQVLNASPPDRWAAGGSVLASR